MDFKLIIYIFALFVIRNSNLFFKRSDSLRNILYSCIFSIVFYLTYDIVKTKKEDFWYDIGVSPPPIPETEIDPDQPEDLYFIKQMGIALEENTRLYKKNFPILSNNEFILKCYEMLKDDKNKLSFIVHYDNPDKQQINYIVFKPKLTNCRPHDGKDNRYSELFVLKKDRDKLKLSPKFNTDINKQLLQDYVQWKNID
jgi:hypothetical protein